MFGRGIRRGGEGDRRDPIPLHPPKSLPLKIRVSKGTSIFFKL